MQCIPLNVIWTLKYDEARCVNVPLVGFVSGIFNAVTDLLVLCLPIPIIWRLHLPLQKRIGMVAIFTTGGV